MSQRDHDREITRRALLRWSLAAGAALGVSRARILEVLERTGGKGIAEAGTVSTRKRSVHLRGGNGGLAWFQLLWPHNAIAAASATNPQLPCHLAGQYTTVAGTGGTLTVCPDSPFREFPNAR